MPLSYQEITNPSSTSFTVSFEFLNLADIKAVGKLNSASTWTELPVTGAATTSSGVTTVTVADAGTYSSAGAIRIYRASTQDPLVDFQNGSRLSESDLDTAYRQGLFAAQEVRENAGENITTVGPQGPAGAAGADATIGAGSIDLDKLSATGTKDATTFLRGDNTFAAPPTPSGGNTPRFSVKKSENQTNIGDNAETLVTFQTEDFDTDNAFASNRFTVPTGKAGVYMLGFNFVGGKNEQTKHIEAKIKLNGVTNLAFGGEDYNQNLGGYIMTVHLTRLVALSEGDYIEFFGKVDSADSSSVTFYNIYSGVACYAYGFKLA